MKTAENRFNFTKRALEAVAVPQGNRTYVYDQKAEGLCLCVTPAGTKTFYLYKWMNGRPQRIPLGKFPTLTVEQARDACRKLLVADANGIDVQQARQAARHEQTVKGLFDYWLNAPKDGAKARGVRTFGEEEKRYDRYLKPWGNRKLSSVHVSDVEALIARVTTEKGMYAANKLLGLLKAMYRRAPKMGYTGENPTVGVTKHKEEERDRFIHSGELQGFFRALLGEPNETMRDLMLMMLMSAGRKTNVASMAWCDIDFASEQWTIPGKKHKNGKPVVVPLLPAAMSILRRRREDTNGPWVFPSNRGKTGHITEVKSAWRRIVTAANLGNCRPHDLRRSLASHMALAGTSLLTIGQMLGHSQLASTKIYARLDDATVRTAAQTAANNIFEAGGVKLLEGGSLVIDVKTSDVEDKSNA